jgi:hypothetical protein
MRKRRSAIAPFMATLGDHESNQYPKKELEMKNHLALILLMPLSLNCFADEEANRQR